MAYAVALIFAGGRSSPLNALQTPIDFGFRSAHETFQGGVSGKAFDVQSGRTKNREVAIPMDSPEVGLVWGEHTSAQERDLGACGF